MAFTALCNQVIREGSLSEILGWLGCARLRPALRGVLLPYVRVRPTERG